MAENISREEGAKVSDNNTKKAAMKELLEKGKKKGMLTYKE